ncbi:hypothetical protein L861_01245 [Litchfieldella anticariensis FP35 = DSM 16096]|uniref:GGDEF domain-containing protein n=1 Tax=Litchfieldella anticariensis (strain DSM 16096 / CECT 5854 / CIP 108499 / LMG 22089 / FP35) TaxID=1121939 RepID=S2KQ01_LITA3|nr:hypothetical protein [Halomonas anticariensis]EPC03955.1 hypothetical protein L861_01245 [Halomonas anticariensis FP35 = DSM 16096]
MQQRIAVLTGDVIESRKIHDQARLFDVLDATLNELTERYGGQGERYRGDGFQLALPCPEYALTAAVTLRAALIRHSEERRRWDARIAVAVGKDAWRDDLRVSEASGEPFVHSGQSLDALSDGQQHLDLRILDGSDGDCPALLTRFVDELIDGWSRYSAEIVYMSLCHDESQQALAKRLGISQPSVHKRLRAARWPLLAEYLAYMHRRLKDETP